MKVAPDEPRKAGSPPDGGALPDCDCLGAGPPPPQFRLPPPPPPPPLRCTQLPPADAEDFCDAPPVFQEAEPWGEPALPSAAAIALGCVLLLLAAAASASVMLWKYRRKAAAGGRCESPRHTRSDASSAGDSSALYEDAASLRPRSLVLRCGATVQTPQGTKHRRGCPAVAGRPVFVCADPYAPHDVCTPVYQEIAPGSPSDPEDHIYAVPVLHGLAAGRSPPEELAVGEASDCRPHRPQQQQQQQGDVALLEALMQRYSGAFSSHGPGCVGAARSSVK
ncbi:uncharacterized protein LOC126267430 [Schistocerca gregaria]|uniref:uncharacterized protein LOC126267430 n=1 Tax=Schistocerca gregaria TaxID=7010 RepID=UPI00211DD95A|nr:uncharacterized protein LOC126267430 [Schistocerca gregaria]